MIQTFVWKSDCRFTAPNLWKTLYLDFCLSFMFSFSDLVPLSGSLKRPVSSHPMSSHLRVLHSPHSSGLNPEGIYVWDSSAASVGTRHVSPPEPISPQNTFVSGYLCTGYLSSTLLCTVVSITWRQPEGKTQIAKERCCWSLNGSHGALGGKERWLEATAWRKKTHQQHHVLWCTVCDHIRTFLTPGCCGLPL